MPYCLIGPAPWKATLKAMLLGLIGQDMPGNLYMVVWIAVETSKCYTFRMELNTVSGWNLPTVVIMPSLDLLQMLTFPVSARR